MFARFGIGLRRIRNDFNLLTRQACSGISSQSPPQWMAMAEDLLRRTNDFDAKIDRSGFGSKESQIENFALFNDWRHILFKIPHDETKILCQSADSIDKLLHINFDKLLKTSVKSSASSKNQKFQPSPTLLDDLTTGIYAWGRIATEDSNSPMRAEALFKKFKKVSDKKTKTDKHSTFRPTSNMYSALVYCWSQATGNDRASEKSLRWFTKIRENRTMTVNSETWNALLRIHVRQGKFLGTARKLLNNYSSLNNGYTFVSLMEGWMNSDLPHGPKKAYEELQRGITYCIGKEDQTPALQQLFFQYLSQSIEKGHISEAEQVMNQAIVIQENYPKLEILDVKHFIVVMNALASKGYTDKVNVLFQKLQNAYERGAQRLQPNYQVLVVVLSALAKKQDFQCLEVGEGLLSMIESYVLTNQSSASVITNHAYNVMLDCYIRIPHVKNRRNRVEKLIKRMEKLSSRYHNPHLLPDKVSYAAFLKAIIQEGKPGFASEIEEIVNGMELSDRVTIQPDINIYAIVLDAFFTSGDDVALFRAKYLFERMERYSDLQPDRVMYTIWMKIHSLFDDVDGSDAVLSTMIQACDSGRADCRPNEKAFITAMSTWERSGRNDAPDAAFRIFNSMISLYNEGNLDCRPSRKTFGKLMVILAKSEHESKMQMGQRLLSQMETYGVDHDLSLLNWYMRVCSTINSKKRSDQRESWTEALFTFNTLREKRLANSHSYNSIFHACDSLLNNPEERYSVFCDVFSKCRNDGQVDKRILASLMRFLPPRLYRDLTTLDPRDKQISMAKVPASWKINKTSIQ